VRLGVIPSVFAWMIASSGTWGSIWLRFSCYSWWLPSPRWLGAVDEYWHELTIVRGHLPVIVTGLVLPGGSRKITLVKCSCHWVTSLVGRFLRCPSEDEVRATPLSRRTTKCWSTQRERSMPASTWTSEENLVSQLCLIGILPVLDCSHIGDWFIPYAVV